MLKEEVSGDEARREEDPQAQVEEEPLYRVRVHGD